MAKKKRSIHDEGLPEWVMTALKVGGVLAAIALVFLAAWSLSALGPHRVNEAHETYLYDSEIPPEVTAMRDQSVKLENEFHDAEKNQAEITADDLNKLEQAIQLEREYLERTGHSLAEGDDRLDDMNKSLQDYQTDPLRKQSYDLEQKSEDEQNAGNNTAAIDSLTEAVKLQETINENYPLTKNRDYSRLAMLQHRIDYLNAQPLDADSHAAEAAAQDALQKEDWGTAQVDFQKAYDLQARINRDYSDQQFTNMARQEDLANELVSLRSTGSHRQVVELLAKAKAAANNPLQAAEFLQDALREQRDLIKDYPESRFADESLAENIDTDLQTALSEPVADEIQRQVQVLAEALRNRHDQEARDQVSILAQKVEHFQDSFPRSPLLQGDLEQRIEYINFKAADLASIQDQVYAQLRPLPGQKTLELFREEIPQSLYQAVIGGNPSRNFGPQLPVDSVSWQDAKEFCRHLEWVLARPVRLPTESEFRLAVGNTSQLDVSAVSWNLDNSGGHTQPVATKAPNAAGFYDLLGNVEEWLERPADASEDEAPVAGGDAQTPVDTIRDATVTEIPMIDRSRFTGFRIVVDLDEAAPLTDAASAGNTTAAPASAAVPVPAVTDAPAAAPASAP
ncbi:MAG: SUMF1/EgtB/PvdO family nonheme iron enzyme [Opitutales bacterium]|jgi:hypothetical protein